MISTVETISVIEEILNQGGTIHKDTTLDLCNLAKECIGYRNNLAARDNATADAALDRAADIALAIDSGRGNEKEIAAAILALKSTTQAQRDAMAKISSEEKRLELE